MIKFDSLDKKPKLWNIAALTAVLLAAVAVLIVTGDGQNHTLAIYLLFDVYYVAVTVLLVRAFIRQLRYNLYSYNTIFYIGFALFTVFIAISHIIMTVDMIKYPDVYTQSQIVYRLLRSAKDYIIITSPFLIVFSVALCVSNISLIVHEGFRPVNVLGIVLSVALIGGAVFIFAFDYYASGSETEVMIHDIITNLIAAIYLYVECMLIGVIIGNSISVRRKVETDKDFLIILGCGLKKDGTPSAILRGRIDRALAFYNKQKEETGSEPTFITSGGKGTDEVNSESASMKRYLMEHGIPEERIIEEDRSRDTFQNMRNSKEIIDRIDAGAKVAYSTTNYHVFRSGIFARRVKMRAAGMGARTKWYFWPNAAVREFAGLLSKHCVKQALILGGIVAFYIVLTIWSYKG